MAGRPGRWTSNGPRTARTVSSTSCRPGPRPWLRSAWPPDRRVPACRRPGKALASGRAVGAAWLPAGCAASPTTPQLARVRARRGAGRRHHLARTGAGDEDRSRHRHQPWRTHLPCRHRGARARHPCRGGLPTTPRETLRDGDIVTVSCAEGAVGHVYDGDDRRSARPAATSPACKRPRTQLMVNLGNPELAFQCAMLPCDGVGLARMEFIINEHINVHPMAVLHPERITDAAVAQAGAGAVAGYADGAELLRRAAGRRRGHDRSRLLPAAGDRAAVRLQEQRIRRLLGGATSSRRKPTR